MPILEIITIGTELLLGEITDTNSTYLARTLRDHGIDIYRITTIGDNPSRIATAIREALTRSDIVITTGGLGPTVDDPTRQAVAKATDRELIFQPNLWEDIVERFKHYGHAPTENNKRQAYIPDSAIPIPNPVGTAPCYVVEVGDSCVVSLPGVPREMEYILHHSIIPYLSQKYEMKSQIIKATVLHAASLGESAIDEKIADLEEMANPTVGLLAHPGQVDIRVTAKAGSEVEAQALSKPVVQELLSRLGDFIYGQDEETLESIVCEHLNQASLKLGLFEAGLDGTFIARVKLGQPDSIVTQQSDSLPASLAEFEKQVTDYCTQNGCDIGFGTALIIHENVTVHLVYKSAAKTRSKTRKYGGPTGYGPLWAQNVGLDFLRREMIADIQDQKIGES
mgnify:CR=1 FL=1